MKPLKNALRKTVCPILHFIGQIPIVILSFIVPAKGRRLMVSASLFAHFDRLDPDTLNSEGMKEYVHHVNRLLQLIEREERALIFPMYIHNRIWGKLDIEDLKRLSREPSGKMVEAVLKQLPWYLRYHPKIMRDDINTIIQRRLLKDVLVYRSAA